MLSRLRLLLRGSTQGPYLWPMLNEKVSKRFYNKTVANKELHNSFFQKNGLERITGLVRNVIF